MGQILYTSVSLNHSEKGGGGNYILDLLSGVWSTRKLVKMHNKCTFLKCIIGIKSLAEKPEEPNLIHARIFVRLFSAYYCF